MLAKMGELLQSCMSKDEVFSAGLGFAPKILPHIRGALVPKEWSSELGTWRK